MDGQQRLTSLYSVMCNQEVRDSDYRSYRIEIAFNPLSETFAVPDAAIKRTLEYIFDITELWTSGGGFAFTTRFLETLAPRREITKEERKAIADNISKLEALEKYPFIGLELSANLEEEARRRSLRSHQLRGCDPQAGRDFHPHADGKNIRRNYFFFFQPSASGPSPSTF